MLSESRNDVSCFFRNQLVVLIEHQSTLNENMPLRFLFYEVELLRKLIDDPECLYRKKQLKFPAPRFFVMYNGKAAAPERRMMKLSDAFGGDDTLELKAEFLNINAGNNRELLARSIDLSWYCAFVERVKFNQSKKMMLAKAIKEAMEYCIANGIMATYLREHEWEVMKMYQYEYDAELDRRANFEDGLEKGRNSERMSMIKNFYKAGTPINFIMSATGWTEEQILAVVNAPDEN